MFSNLLMQEAAQAAVSPDYAPAIIFPNLGIRIPDLTTGFSVFGIWVAWYGVIIAVGMILAAIIVYNLARRTGQNADNYIEVFVATVIFGIIGARIYYVLFSWSYYAEHPNEILMIRNGGLAIYGGIILGAITIIVVCRIKKMNLLQVLDTCVPGVVIAQAIGRWGNFINREAFGGYTDGLFAMQMKVSDVPADMISSDLKSHMLTKFGTEHYIQCHPTFFYESMWCLLVFILIMIFRKKAKYRGEVLLWYLGGYGLGRMIIESLRTDSLMIAEAIPVSQLLALILFIGSLAILVVMRIYIMREPEKYSFVNLTVEGWQDLKFEKPKKEKKEAASVEESGEEKQPEETTETEDSDEPEKTE